MRRAVVGIMWVVLLLTSASASAQMANALGQPLPDGNLEAGTVTIRVVDGDPQKPLAGVTVELIAAQGENRTARTNPQGRATFTGLAPDAAYVGRATVPADDGSEAKPLETQPFRVPSEGGLRFMLSPKPLTMGGAAPSDSGGAESGAPRMDPRRASGIPRPDQNDPPGRLTVRAMQGDLQQTDRSPVGAEIHLIGFAADGSVTKVSGIVDQSERVTFDGLVTGGRVVYYAVALFARDGVVDRLASQPIIMPPRVGVRLMLAGLAKDSKEPPIDELAKLESAPAAAPGRVVVRVGGRDIESVREVDLVEVGRPDVVARSGLREAMPAADEIKGVARPVETVAEQAEPVVVGVQRILGTSSEPVAGSAVRLRIAAGGEGVGETVTGADGMARFAQVAAKDTKALYEVEIVVHGKAIVSQPFALAATGGVRIDFDTAWQALGLEAAFDGVAPGADKVYIARLKAYGRVFRSSPFQLTEGLGATVNMLVFPGLIVAFHGGGEVDDEMFWFQTQFTLYNPGKQPYLPPEGNVDVPLPRGFVSAQVQDEMTAMVTVTKSGLQWRGPVPPGGNAFIATFALPVEDGAVHYEMPLPMGAFQSQMVLRETSGMTLVDGDGKPPVERMGPEQVPIKVLAGVPIRETQDRDGRPLLVLSNLNIPPNQSLVLGIQGLPQRPAWQHWVKLVVGLVVVSLLAWGIVGLYRGRRGAVAVGASALEERRDQLFDEIVALERKGLGDSDEVADLKNELARVYRQLGANYD